MDTIQAIYDRRSIRAFKPDPVRREVLEKIMSATLMAPSWENTQPWEFAVIGGDKMKELLEAMNARRKAGPKPNMDMPWPKFTGVYLERAKRDGKRLFQAVGIGREDHKRRADWYHSMTRFFHAPNGIIIYMDSALGEWSFIDIGIVLQTLMLSAWHHGVGTCALAAAIVYPDVLRQVLSIPESKRIVVGVALGYPDMENAGSTFRAEREGLDALVRWHGV